MNFDDLIISPEKTHHLYEGVPIYKQRFDTVGRFCFPGLAAARDAAGACHITFAGEPAYAERYDWTGDFAEEVAVVRDAAGRYFHIDPTGKPIAFDTYQYATEFAEGSAVVYHELRGATHITTAGELLYGDWYFDARPFSEGRAAVRDEKGWMIIDPEGNILGRTGEPAGTFPVRGSVRYTPVENPIPEILQTADWDAAAVLMRHGEREPFRSD